MGIIIRRKRFLIWQWLCLKTWKPFPESPAAQSLDATYIAVRRYTVSKEAVYIAVGIREDGSKEVLVYTIAPTESAYNWQGLPEELKDRGIEDVLLFVSDGLKGMSNAVFNVFPKTKYH